MIKVKWGLFVMFAVAFVLTILQGCANYATHTLYNTDKSEAYQMEEMASWGFFGPTYQWSRTKICDVKKTHVHEAQYGNGYDKFEPVNCRLMTAADGYQKDLGSPVGPTVMQAGGTVAAGALIADGIRDSSDNINNTNAQSQGQVQKQKQYQYQRQRQNQGQHQKLW